MPSRRRRVGRLVSGADYNTYLLDARRQDFLDEDPQRGLGDPVPVHQRLQRESPLAFARGRNDGFLDFHGFLLSLSNKAQRALQNGSRQSTAGRPRQLPN